MNRGWKNLLFAVVLVFSLTQISCSSKSKILGSWKGSNTGQKFSFFKDGTFSFYLGENCAPYLNGTYSLLDSKNMILVAQKKQMKMPYYFEGDNFICELSPGQKEIFIKVK